MDTGVFYYSCPVLLKPLLHWQSYSYTFLFLWYKAPKPLSWLHCLPLFARKSWKKTQILQSDISHCGGQFLVIELSITGICVYLLTSILWFNPRTVQEKSSYPKHSEHQAGRETTPSPKFHLWSLTSSFKQLYWHNARWLVCNNARRSHCSWQLPLALSCFMRTKPGWHSLHYTLLLG